MVKRIDDCDTNRLRSYLDDELSDGDQAELAGHLDHCADCQAALERLAAGTRIWDDLRGLGRASGPADAGPPGRRRGDEGPADARGRRGRARFPRALGVPGFPGPTGTLRDPRRAGAGGHGRRAQGVRAGAEPRRGDQGAGPADGRQRRRPQAVLPRGQGRRRGRPRSCRRHPRGGRRPEVGPAVPGHAVHRRPIAPGADRPRRPAAHRGGPAHRDADRAGPGRRPRPGPGPSRHQAVEHPAGERRGAGQDHRLRARPRHRRRQPVAERRRGRHAAVHVARAGRAASRWTTGPTSSAWGACCMPCAPGIRRSGPRPRWACSAASATRSPGRWSRSTPTCPNRSRP